MNKLVIYILRAVGALVGLFLLVVSVEMSIRQVYPLMQHADTVIQFAIPVFGNLIMYALSIATIVTSVKKW